MNIFKLLVILAFTLVSLPAVPQSTSPISEDYINRLWQSADKNSFSGLANQPFIVVWDGDHPNKAIRIQAKNAITSQLLYFNPGDHVRVFFTIEGATRGDVTYNNLFLTKIEKLPPLEYQSTRKALSRSPEYEPDKHNNKPR